jgi:multiple sugar transport system substrate-binding protein
MNRRGVILAAAILFASVSVFAEGGAEGASGPAEVKKVYFYAWTHPDNMVPLLNEFNKAYTGKYEMVYQKLADAATMTINTALSSGEPVHVMTQASAFDLRQRADSGVYLGLKRYFDKEKLKYSEVFGKSIEETQNINGDYYSMPYTNNINMVYFNKKMFDAAGVKYPDPNWTWDDFRATAKKLTKGTGANKIYGAMLDVAKPNGDHYWATIAQQKLGSFWYYSKDFKSTRFDDPAMKESLQFFHDLYMVDGSAVPLAEYTALKLDNDTTGMKGLYGGRYAMWVAPVYGTLYLNKSYGEIPADTDIGVTNLPRPASSAGPITTSYTSQACIPANAPDKDAAWTAIKYICIDRADLFAGPKAMHPGYQFKTVEDANKFNEIIFGNHPGLDFDMAMKVMALPRTIVSRDNTHVQGQAKINELINATMSRVFNGEMSVDAALKELKTKGDQFILADLK